MRTNERALDLEGRLEARLGRSVQVVVLDYAPPELIQNVLGHGRLLFSGNEASRVRFYGMGRGAHAGGPPEGHAGRGHPPLRVQVGAR